jgi:hypothetical protein
MTKAAEKAATEVLDDLPVQVPVPVSDPLYAEVIGSLETDLSAARERASKAERKVKELGAINDEVELLRDKVDHMRNELSEVKALVANMSTTINAMYGIHSRVFRS